MLAPRPIPIAQSRGDAFDAMVLHAVDHLQPRLAEQLAQVEFAVEDVPSVVAPDSGESSRSGANGFIGTGHSQPSFPEAGLDDDVLDDRAVPLSRLYRTGMAGISAPVIVLYRRPLESRAARPEDLADLVHDVVVEQVARLLGRSPEEIDPSGD